MSGDPEPKSKVDDRRDPEAAAIGVVVAGVLASFVIPGPFDWGSTLIGLMLVLVLVGYGKKPRDWRERLGMASARASAWSSSSGGSSTSPSGGSSQAVVGSVTGTGR
jgi:hypothetical protein